MSCEEYGRKVDWIFVQNDFQNVYHILFAEFECAFRFGCNAGSLFGRGLGLAKDCGQSQRRSICSHRAVAERRDDDITVLLSQALDLFAVHVHVPVLIGASAVEYQNQRQLRLTVPCGGNVEAVWHRLIRRRKIIRSMLITLRVQLRVWRRQKIFCEFPGFRNLPIGLQRGAKRDRLPLRQKDHGDERE